MSNPAYVVVGYACVQENSLDLGSPDHLTVHRGQWALCAVPYDEPHEHHWAPTGRLTYVELIRRLASSPRFRRRLQDWKSDIDYPTPQIGPERRMR